MAKPDGRVEAGQSLKRAISAQRWNDLCDAADIVHGRRGGVTASARGRTHILARTESPWSKGASANLEVMEGPPGQEVRTGFINAYNHLADINSNKFVVLVRLGATWCVIAAEC